MIVLYHKCSKTTILKNIFGIIVKKFTYFCEIEQKIPIDTIVFLCY
ncbi:MAG: hypothetical protein ACFWUC_06805 [Oscillospiraceae bacterium]|jgi:hypothetical protein